MPCCFGHAAAPKLPAPWTKTTRSLNMHQAYSTGPSTKAATYAAAPAGILLLAAAKELVETLGQVQLGRIEIAALLAERCAGGNGLGGGPPGLSVAEFLRGL